MKYALCLLVALIAGPAAAYSGTELRDDCQAADALYHDPNAGDPATAARGARCLGYVAGFADGYAVSDYLADKVGIRLNAFCLPPDDNLPQRLVRAVLGQFDRVPAKSDGGTASIVAAALARSFPCADALEPRK